MNKFYKIILGVAILGLLIFSVTLAVKKEKVGAYNNQYDGIVVSKILTSSNLSTSTATAITQYSTGDFYIDNIVLTIL